MIEVALGLLTDTRMLSVISNIAVMTLLGGAALLVWSFEPEKISPIVLSVFLSVVALFFMRRFILSTRGNDFAGWDWGAAGSTIATAIVSLALVIAILHAIEAERRSHQQSLDDGQSVHHIQTPNDMLSTQPDDYVD